MCWLTAGLLLGEPGSKLVHVLILLLSNQVENRSGVFGWVGERGKRFPCSTSCGVFVSKNIHVFLLHNRRNLSSVFRCHTGCVLCIS